jgi:energy-coupling factor transporter ATP-binding protein EcfA2
MNMLRDFNRHLGMTVVMVTHERTLAERYAERLLFLGDGKLIGDESNSLVSPVNKLDRAGTEGARP